MAAADVGRAQAQVNALTTFLDAVTAVQDIANGGVIVPEYEQIVLAQAAAQQLVTTAQQNATALTEAAANPASTQLANLIDDAGLDISEHGMYGYPEQFIPQGEYPGGPAAPAVSTPATVSAMAAERPSEA